MTQFALPKKLSRPAATRWPVMIAVGAVGLLVASGVVYTVAPGLLGRSSTTTSQYKSVPVKRGPFAVRVNVRGDLAAVDNIDIICEIEGSTTITQLVPEGTFVKKGQTLVTFDGSQIRLKLEDSQIELQRASADVTTATEMLEIQKSQNAANLEAADVALQLAQIDIRSYTEGTWPQQLADAKMALEKAQTGLKTKQDELQQSRSLFAKGFVTATEVKTKETDVLTAQADVTKAETSLKVLVDYSHEADMAAKKNTLAQTEQKLSRTKRENAANLSQKQADLDAKRQSLSVITRRTDRLVQQVAKCIIKAPADGLVVYQNSGGDRNQTPIQEGSQVRERQTMLRLPDTSRMKVVLKVNETQVMRLSVGQSATIVVAGQPRPLSGQVTKISPISDSGGRWWNPDQKEYPVDVLLDETPDGLKPGMGGEVSVTVDQADDVLSIPMASLYTAGGTRYAFVPIGEGVRPVAIKIGRTNEQDIEVMEGLEAGTQVVMLEAGQGKLLLERAGIKVEEQPTDQTGTPGGGRKRRNGAAPGNGEGKPPAGAPTAGPAVIPAPAAAVVVPVK